MADSRFRRCPRRQGARGAGQAQASERGRGPAADCRGILRLAGSLTVHRACSLRHWDVRDTGRHHFYDARNKHGLRSEGPLENRETTRHETNTGSSTMAVALDLSSTYIIVISQHRQQAWRGSAGEMEWDGRMGRANKSWVYFRAALYIGSAIMAASFLFLLHRLLFPFLFHGMASLWHAGTALALESRGVDGSGGSQGEGLCIRLCSGGLPLPAFGRH